MDQNSASPGYQPLIYTNPMNMINGNGGAANNETKVDLSAWDQATVCGSCHPGGTFMEKDRNNVRYSSMQAMGMVLQGQLTPLNAYVFEKWNSTTGAAEHSVQPAPWFYPATFNGSPVIAPNGWGNSAVLPYFTLPNGDQMPVSDGQVMMPNVKEFDCLQCHGAGFGALVNSVMTYSGALSAAPSFGAGFMDMFTEAYKLGQGLVDVIPGTAQLAPFSTGPDDLFSMVQYNASNLKKNPASENCQACHLPSEFKDLPDMFRDFLSSAPMIYSGSFRKSFTGLTFPSYDLNAPFGRTWDWQVGPYATTPYAFYDMTGQLHLSTPYNLMIPGGWPAALGDTPFNKTLSASLGGSVFNGGGFMGGANPAGTLTDSGPIYYYTADAPAGNDMMSMMGRMDQNSLRKSVVAFPRAEWFKRGDVWIDGYDVHKFLECSGCHMDTATTKVDTATFNGKSLCDPGRGFDSASGIESSNLADGTLPGNPGAGFAGKLVNSQSTVKSCENCHVTGKNNQGVAINNFGAPNVVSSHTTLGLYDTTTKGVNAVGPTGTFKGSHMDVLDCTVCHLYRKQMVVRTLDSTSGLRFPNMLGLKPQLGMMGMMYDGFGQGNPIGSNEEEFRPLFTWQKWGNEIKAEASSENPWRRKIYGINYIDAVIWNNEDSSIDANGDGVTGRPPEIHAHNGDVGPTYQYDNWISRDMKDGMNFMPGGFANIPSGFGNMMNMDPFSSAYNLDGTLNGSWNYVGLYGGNVIFSTPEEIDGYLTMRGANWAGTKLTFAAAPFKMTHGIRKPSTFALGKSCADCHAPGAGFFDGEFEMLGYAVKSTDALAMPYPYTGNMMMSPARKLEVVAKADQLATGAELANKAGGLLELEFDEHVCWDPASRTHTEIGATKPGGGTCTAEEAAEYKRVKNLDRGEVLYPTEATITGVDGTVYTKAQWLKHLTDIAAPPVAEIASVSNSTLNGDIYSVATGASIVFTAVNEQNPSFTYQWSFSDGVTVPAGLTATRTFSTVNTIVTATLKVKSTVTGEIASLSKYVSVGFPASFNITTTVNPLVSRKAALALSGMTATHTSLRVEWGDGTTNTYSTTLAAYTTPLHTYYGTGDKTAKIRIFNGTKQIDEKTFLVDMP